MRILSIDVAYDGQRIATRWEVPLVAANARLLPRSLGATFTPVARDDADAMREAVAEHLETLLVQILAQRGKGHPTIPGQLSLLEFGQVLDRKPGEAL